MKKCNRCNIVKEDDDFGWKNKKQNKRMTICKDCTNKEQRDRRKDNPEKIREQDRQSYLKNQEKRKEQAKNYREKYPERTMNTNLKSKYGITSEEYYEMLKKQDYKCAICGKPSNEHSRKLSVDHNHKTGKVRGLLCDGCNYGVGFLEKRKNEYEEYIKKYDF